LQSYGADAPQFFVLRPWQHHVEPNRQIDGNEKLHKNHLHITARDPYLQP
jgi:hypothetical protein